MRKREQLEVRFRTTRRALRADDDDGRGAPMLPLHEKDGGRVIQAHCGRSFRDADEKVGDDESRRGLEIERGHNRKRIIVGGHQQAADHTDGFV